MPPRLLLFAFALALVGASSAVSAQTYTTPYNTLDTPSGDRWPAPGFRIGLSAGFTTYFGPDYLNVNDTDGAENNPDNQDNVMQTRPAVNVFASFPLSSDRLYGRLQAGLANLGAGSREDVVVAGGNPFLTNMWFVPEADLMLNLTSPRRSSVTPYIYSGFGAIIADPFGQDDDISRLGHSRVAYFVPAGIGADFRLSRNLSLFLEASYKFVVNSPGRAYTISTGGGALTGTSTDQFFAHMGGEPCEEKPDKPECGPKPPEEDCLTNPELEGCVLDSDSTRFTSRFGVGSLMGGIALGFLPAPPPVAYIPPPPVVVDTPEVLPEVEELPPAPVCELVELNSVYFDYGSATISAGARSLLAENVQLLRENPECCIFVDGYTDASEYDRFGMPLAGRRAQAVYDYYLENGVGASRMHVRNRGVTTPDCDKEDEGPGCERGRRVETIPMDCDRFQRLLENPTGY